MKIKCFILLMISFFCYGEEAIKPDKLILYKKTSNANLYLHAFYPKEISNKDNLPTIVFFLEEDGFLKIRLSFIAKQNIYPL